MRLALPTVLLALVMVLPGCGSSGGAQHHRTMTAPSGASAQSCGSAGGPMTSGAHMRVTGTTCRTGRQLMMRWRRQAGCRPAAGGSRSGCRLRGFLCTATASGRGYSVSCATPGRSLAFTVPRR